VEFCVVLNGGEWTADSTRYLPESLHSVIRIKDPLKPFAAVNFGVFWRPVGVPTLVVDEHTEFFGHGWLEYWVRMSQAYNIALIQLYPNWWEKPPLTVAGEHFLTHSSGLGFCQFFAPGVIDEHGMFADFFEGEDGFFAALEYVKRVEAMSGRTLEDIGTKYRYDGPLTKHETHPQSALFFHREKCVVSSAVHPRLHNEVRHDLYERVVRA
jgi:hypothetical protein